MTLHISLVGRKDLSIEIYRQIRDAIVNGILRPGDRLPASRELARTLSVSRMTVTVAYERLSAEGSTVSHVGNGTFVSALVDWRRAGRLRGAAERRLQPRRFFERMPLPTAFAKPARFDFRTGIPDGSAFSHTRSRRLFLRAMRAHWSDKALYGDPAGDPTLRAAIARHIGSSRGVMATPDDVIVTNGTQQALDVVARVLFSPLDRVAVEDPGYWPPRRIFEALGARVVPVPVDCEGLVVQSIPRHVRAVYVTPSHQYPMGVSMTLPRRQMLLAWADRHDAAVLEDDYDSEFRFGDRPLEPLRTLDVSGRVVYVGSFSKTLWPSLRLGFIIAPPSLRAAIERAKFLADWHSPTLLQIALARFIDDGEFARHLRRLRAVYGERYRLVHRTIRRDFCDDLELIPSNTGLHLAAIARGLSVDRIEDIARRALARGVAIQTLAGFAAGGRAQAGIVLGYGGIATADIAHGLRTLRGCFAR